MASKPDRRGVFSGEIRAESIDFWESIPKLADGSAFWSLLICNTLSLAALCDRSCKVNVASAEAAETERPKAIAAKPHVGAAPWRFSPISANLLV